MCRDGTTSTRQTVGVDSICPKPRILASTRMNAPAPDYHPSGEAKGQLRKLFPFNEPLNFPTLRADAIRPYSSADEVK